MLTDTVILTLMNVLKMWRASPLSCQNVRPGVTSVMEKEEEEAKADTEQMLSVIFWVSCFGLSRSSSLLVRQRSRAGSYQGKKSLFRPWSELPKAELEGCEISSAKPLVSL